MDREKLPRIYQRYLRRVEEFEEQLRPHETSYSKHITRTLLQTMSYASSRKDLSKSREKFVLNLKALREYMRLIDQFSEFRETEVTLDDTPYFPEGPLRHCRKYVDHARGKLEQAA